MLLRFVVFLPDFGCFLCVSSAAAAGTTTSCGEDRPLAPEWRGFFAGGAPDPAAVAGSFASVFACEEDDPLFADELGSDMCSDVERDEDDEDDEDAIGEVSFWCFESDCLAFPTLKVSWKAALGVVVAGAAPCFSCSSFFLGFFLWCPSLSS